MEVTNLTLPAHQLEKSEDFNKASTAIIPDALTGPLVWSGADFKSEEPYTLHIGAGEVSEIKDALKYFKNLGLDGDEVSKENFPLANLGQRIESHAKDIHNARGFFVVRGLDMDSYTIEDSVTVYLGIAGYVGNQRGLQDRKGNMLSHVTNSKLWTAPVNQRHGIHSSIALPFHNDMGCDIMALQVRHSARNGGCTYLSSSWKVFNELLHAEPEVAMILLTPDWPVQVSGRKARYYLAPAFKLHEGRLMTSMDPSRFGPHPNSGNTKIPELTFKQQYALKRVSDIAYEHELQLQLQTGDLLFFNNWALLHRRDAYKDDEQTSRHMVRLWLRNSSLGWSVPKELLPPWSAAFGEKENRKISARLYPLIPMPEYDVPKYSAGSAAFMIEESEESEGSDID